MGLIRESIILVSVVVGLSMSHSSLGQSGGCTTALITLSPCLTYINAAAGTASNTPSSSCCSRLATIVQSQPRCLCSALSGGGAAASLGVTINQTRALQLPAACRLQTPPPSRCNGNYCLYAFLFNLISNENFNTCIFLISDSTILYGSTHVTFLSPKSMIRKQ